MVESQPHSFLESFRYTYTGNDTIPSSTTYTYQDPPDQTQETTFHFYDAQHRKVRDSLVSIRNNSGTAYLSKEINLFIYGLNRLFKDRVHTDISPIVAVYSSRDTADLDSRGNILTNKRYSFNGTTYVQDAISNFTYDNHLSPFAKLSNLKAHTDFPNGETLFYEYLSYSNRLTQLETSFGVTTSVSYNYVYNALGLPIIQNEIFNGGVGQYRFKYKSL